MASHLIYHPKRQKQTFGSTTVYFDKPRGNQDPYVWNEPFLHSYCHITELAAPKADDINFWISGDNFPDFDSLQCDLVFVVAKRVEWADRNIISATDPIVDSADAYGDHYRWAYQHPYKTRRRTTLKAEPTRSFQPQDSSGNLVDVLPELNAMGFPTNSLRAALRKGFASKPMPLSSICANRLYSFVKCSSIRLTGGQLRTIRSSNQSLASPAPRSN